MATGLAVAVGANRIDTSADGINWTTANPIPGETWKAVTWAEALGLFVVGSEAGVIMTSPDAVTWTQQTSPTTLKMNEAVWCAGIGLLVIACDDGWYVTSPDGVTWTLSSASLNAGAYDLSSLAWSESLGVLVIGTSGTGSGELYWTNDGLASFTTVTPSSHQRYSVKRFEDLGLFATCGTGGSIWTSPDGNTWTQRRSGSSQWVNDVSWSPDLDIGVAALYNNDVEKRGEYVNSSDGLLTWGAQTPWPVTNDARRCIWCPEIGRFITAHLGGYISYSETGTSWTSIQPHGSSLFRGITWRDEVVASDTTDPTVTIDEVHGPGEFADIHDAAGYDSGTDTLTVTGTAADNVDVTSVEVRVNGGAWTTATGTTSWSIDLDVSAWPAGRHLIEARSLDAAANESAIAGVTVWHSPDGRYGYAGPGQHAQPLTLTGHT